MTSDLHTAIRDPEKRATLAFLAVRGVGPASCGWLREAFGSLAAALEAGPARYLEVLRVDAAQDGQKGPAPEARADAILEYCEKNDIQVLFRGDPLWPTRLVDMERAGWHEPEVLFVRGTLRTDKSRFAGVVGTRQPSGHGPRVAERLGATLAGDAVVVSGGAAGIDTCAHLGALSQKGTTWAVLGSGFKRVFPSRNRELFERIAAEGGAVLTELPPDHETKEGTFPRRNKLVAALSEILVVVQGGVGSGALITARDVIDLNTKVAGTPPRILLAVPGGIEDPSADGPNMLLRQGQARGCGHSTDALVALGLRSELAIVERPGQKVSESAVGRLVKSELAAEAPPVAPPVLDASLEPVWRALSAAPRHFDELAVSVQWPVPTLASALTQLELLGLCEQRPGKLFVRRSG